MNWKNRVGNFQIHTKTGREQFLIEVGNWWRANRPHQAHFFKTQLQRLRQIAKNPDGSYYDAKRREYYVKIRVPQELWLFLRRLVPDFGDNSADIELLTRVWCDLVRPAKDNRRHTRLYICKDSPHEQKRKTSNGASQ